MNKALFVVIDGPSGSGKDSVVKNLTEDLNKINIKAFTIEETKEKTYNREKILQAVKIGDKKTAESIISERKKLYSAIVAPKLLKGICVIANRGEPSTLAYQTLKQQITQEDVWTMHRNADILLPDLIVILNCEPQEALRRQKLRQSLAEKDKKFLSGKFSSRRQHVHVNYTRLKNFLKNKGLAVLYLKNDKITIDKQSEIIIKKIKELNNL